MENRYPLPGVGQVPAELDRLRALYRERAPGRVLEIGVWHGGTLREWLQHAAPAAVVVAVDTAHIDPAEYDSYRKADTSLVVGQGRSQSDEMIFLMEQHGRYDWVFIDGDHSQEAVDSDVELGLRLTRPGGLLLLHDISAEHHPATPPRLALERLREQGYRVDEIVEDPEPSGYPHDSGHGIGVVYL